MSKLFKDIKETLTETVIHNIVTSKSRKSTSTFVIEGVRHINKIVVDKVSK